MIVVVAVAVLVWFDGRRFGEPRFHANLGTPPWIAPGIAAVTAAVLELVAAALLRSLPS